MGFSLEKILIDCMLVKTLIYDCGLRVCSILRSNIPVIKFQLNKTTAVGFFCDVVSWMINRFGNTCNIAKRVDYIIHSLTICFTSNSIMDAYSQSYQDQVYIKI